MPRTTRAKSVQAKREMMSRDRRSTSGALDHSSAARQPAPSITEWWEWSGDLDDALDHVSTSRRKTRDAAQKDTQEQTQGDADQADGQGNAVATSARKRSRPCRSVPNRKERVFGARDRNPKQVAARRDKAEQLVAIALGEERTGSLLSGSA